LVAMKTCLDNRSLVIAVCWLQNSGFQQTCHNI
jgi:hypothetical protein